MTKLKLCFISDTHTRLNEIVNDIPECDYLFHCGDMTNFGTVPELEEVNRQLGLIKDRGVVKNEIIVVAGNHDGGLEKDLLLGDRVFTNAKYLCNNTYTLNNSYIVYGSPYVSKFYNWAFMKERGSELTEEWKKIPDNVDILITHSPSYGILDKNHLGVECGSLELYDRIRELKSLKLHSCGHIHQGNGSHIKDGVVFVNASIMSSDPEVLNKPIVIELDV